MKKSLLLLITFLVIGTAFAQKVKLQKITFGVVVPVSGTTTLSSPLKPFTLGYNLLPNIVLVTNKSYHNFLYGTGNNVLRTIQGWKPKKDMGVYIAAQKNLSKSGGYVGVGIEKFIPVHENITFFLFTEVGTAFGLPSNQKTFSVGMHMNIQSPIWKRQKK